VSTVRISESGGESLGRLLRATRNRPDVFITTILGVKQLRSWQLDICRRITAQLEGGNKRVRVVVRTAHGSGKTFLAAALLIWWLSTRRDSRVLTTAPSWSMVEDLLWRLIGQLYSKSLLKTLRIGRLLNTRLDFGGTWFAVGASSDRPENLEGHHSPFSAARFVDEAKSVPESVFVSTEGLLNSAESFDCWISTPSIEEGSFYRRDMSDDANLIRAVVTIDDLIADPLISESERNGYRAWKREMGEVWGAGSSQYEARVNARYIPDSASQTVFQSGWLEVAMKRSLRVDHRVVAGFDPAGSVDGDQSAVCVVAGPDRLGRYEVKSIAAWHERDTTLSAGRAIAIAREANASVLRVDVVGIGKGIADAIRASGFPVEEYRSSDKAHNSERFFNRKAEDAWFARELFENGRIKIPDDRRFKSQLTTVKYRIDQSGKLRTVDPTDSPDLVDAFIIATARPRVGIATFFSAEF
jgi:hypothetical protein